MTATDTTARAAERAQLRAQLRSEYLAPPAERPASSARGLHHTALISQDVQRTIEFFELLGFAALPAPESIAPFVSWLESDGTQIHLIHTPEPTVPTLGHPAVVAAEFGETVAALREAGFRVEEAERLWGEPRAFAIAPAGHRVELMRAPPPPGSAPRSGREAPDITFSGP